MRLRLMLLITLLALSLSSDACKDSGDTLVGSPPPGGSPVKWSYRGYNSKGSLIVIGKVVLAQIDSTTINGTWILEGITAGEQVGPQLGTGKLTGMIQGTSISMNLNPGWADNNVVLSGTVEKDRISGKWTWITFVGPTAEGTFEAIKTS